MALRLASIDAPISAPRAWERSAGSPRAWELSACGLRASGRSAGSPRGWGRSPGDLRASGRSAGCALSALADLAPPARAWERP